MNRFLAGSGAVLVFLLVTAVLFQSAAQVQQSNALALATAGQSAATVALSIISIVLLLVMVLIGVATVIYLLQRNASVFVGRRDMIVGQTEQRLERRELNALESEPQSYIFELPDGWWGER